MGASAGLAVVVAAGDDFEALIHAGFGDDAVDQAVFARDAARPPAALDLPAVYPEFEPLPAYEPLDNSGVSVRFRWLEKSFGQRQVLGGIDLAVAAGEFVAVVDRSGCGKAHGCVCWRDSTRPPAGRLSWVVAPSPRATCG